MSLYKRSSSGYFALTEQQRDAILRLAGEVDADGEWLLSYQQIAKHVGVARSTVERAIRQAAVQYGKFTGWRDPGFG